MHTASIHVLLAGAALLMASCGASEPPPPERPRSAAGMLDTAERSEQEAAQHEAMAGRPEARVPPDHCVTPLDDVSTTGGEPLVVRRPCWTGLLLPDLQHRREAARLREQAARHRERAEALLRMEREACTGLDQDAIDHSPFFHGEDILEVEPYTVAGELRGARVRFREVPGLTVAWMRDAIRCHQARAAVMGYSDTFQPYCPLMIEGVSARVEDTPAGILVTLQARDAGAARAVLDRARSARITPPEDAPGDAPGGASGDPPGGASEDAPEAPGAR